MSIGLSNFTCVVAGGAAAAAVMADIGTAPVVETRRI
jgi:hypothetical protein